MNLEIFDPIFTKEVFRNDCPASTIQDLKDHIAMRMRVLPVRVQFESIRNCWVTESGRTIWSLCNEANNIESGIYTIGNPDYGPFNKTGTFYDLSQQSKDTDVQECDATAAQ